MSISGNTTTPFTTIVDLALPWVEAPLYNQNQAYCTLQKKLNTDETSVDTIGYAVIQHGELIAEGYTPGHTRKDLSWIASATKSWASLLVGIMIDEGHLALDETLGDIFDDPATVDWSNVDQATEKQDVTVGEILNMNAGFRGTGAPSRPGTAIEDMLNMLQYVPSQRGLFYYAGGSHIVSHIMAARLPDGLASPGEFAKDRGVYESLGLGPGDTSFEWPLMESGVEGSAVGVFTNPYHLAKLGQLFLQGGMCGTEERLVSESWIADSATNHLELGDSGEFPAPFAGYSNLWYVPIVAEDEIIAREKEDVDDFHGAGTAAGAGGQYLAYLPAHDLTIAIMGNGADAQIFNAVFMLGLVQQVPALSIPQTCDEERNVILLEEEKGTIPLEGEESEDIADVNSEIASASSSESEDIAKELSEVTSTSSSSQPGAMPLLSTSGAGVLALLILLL